MKLYVGGKNKNLKKIVKLGVQYVLCYCLILHGLTRHIANITADSLVNPLMPTALLMTTRDRFSYFRSGVVDKYLGGGGGVLLLMLWPGPGGNVQKSQGKCLTKLVF